MVPRGVNQQSLGSVCVAAVLRHYVVTSYVLLSHVTAAMHIEDHARVPTSARAADRLAPVLVPVSAL